jgi:tRNA threonylcarbamoyladenosine biosynthesis protein TsaE
VKTVRFISNGEADSLALGRELGTRLEAGDVLALWGELGAGKTLFTRGVARGLGVPEMIPITSPTFTIMNEYDARLHLYHLDLYRLTSPRELDALPWREALYGAGVAVIEWPDRLGSMLPEDRWDVTFEWLGDESRALTLGARGGHQETRLAALEGLSKALLCPSEMDA